MSAGRSWTNHEVQRLKLMRIAKRSQQEIGDAIGRTKSAVSTMCRYLRQSGELPLLTPLEEHRVRQRATIDYYAKKRGQITYRINPPRVKGLKSQGVGNGGVVCADD